MDDPNDPDDPGGDYIYFRDANGYVVTAAAVQHQPERGECIRACAPGVRSPGALSAACTEGSNGNMGPSGPSLGIWLGRVLS